MTIQAEVVKNGASEHRVQFYDCDADLVESAGSFLEEGVRAGELAVVIATEVHRREFGRYLAAAGIDVTAATAGGSLLLLDAATTLSGFVSDGQVAPDRFRSVISPVLRHAAGRRVRAYGEMVALLWDAGHVPAAIDLEGLWNGILREIPVSLLCAYRSESVSGPDDADALRDVCGLHSTVVSCTGDPHATGCSAHHEVVRGFAAELDAPYAARRFVVEELEARGCDERLVYEAALVVTELASNAVLHAGSP
ncbi:MAG: hypothetical protein QOF30_3011, partial [Acidimicrobiaceae bacterium]|nr:hypothetical protein [Acidimicrobiaceae bacterium]